MMKRLGKNREQHYGIGIPAKVVAIVLIIEKVYA